MLLPQGGVEWKSAKARFPPTRAFARFAAQPRIVLLIAGLTTFIIIWRALRGTSEELHK